MKRLLSLFLCCIVSVSSIAYGYIFTDDDYDVLDIVEEKLFYLMDQKGWTADFTIDALENIVLKHSLNERQQNIFDLLIEDVAYFGESTGSDDEWTMMPEDCYDDETYSEEDQWCYPSEVSEDEDYSSDEENDDKDHDEELKVLTTYSISNDKLTLTQGEENELHAKVRAMFSRITPQDTRPFLIEAGFADDAENSTDAFVTQADTADTWKIVFNLGSFQGNNIDTQTNREIMIHEYAHLIAYGPSQVNYVAKDLDDATLERYAEKCKTYFESEGCLQEDAYMVDFITKYWNADELKITQVDGEPDDYTADEYITEYAATNHGEDFAESFAFYVLKAKPAETTTERDQKMLFFYDYPELVKLRNLIRSRLD